MQITTGARQLEEIADEEPDFFTMDQSEEIELSSLILDSKRTRLSHGPESLAQAFFEQEVAAIPIPNDEQYQDIFRDLGRGGIARQQAIHALVTGNLRYVFLWAKRYYTAARRSRMTFLDVIQEGGRGLQRAAEKFKPELGYKFTTYATWWIKQLITRAIYNCYGPYRIPMHVHETNRQIRKSSTNLDPDLDFSERSSKMQELTDLGPEKIEDITNIFREYISLDTSPRDDDKEHSPAYYLAAPASNMDIRLKRAAIRSAMSILKAKERLVLMQRFGLLDGHQYTLAEIGEGFGISRERVRQIQSKALRQLRQNWRSKTALIEYYQAIDNQPMAGSRNRGIYATRNRHTSYQNDR